MIIIFGAFLVAIIFGGIASEVQLANNEDTSSEDLIAFMQFSIEIHKLPDTLNKSIIEYMRTVEEVVEAR